jgi:hypothetical protein
MRMWKELKAGSYWQVSLHVIVEELQVSVYTEKLWGRLWLKIWE